MVQPASSSPRRASSSSSSQASVTCRLSLTNLLLAVVLCCFLLMHIPLLLSSYSTLPIESTISSALSNSQVRHGKKQTLEALENRVQYLETKLNSYLSFGVDPFQGLGKTPALCQRQSDLTEFACQDGPEECEADPRQVCLDGLLPKSEQPQKPCIVYDFGIREEPQFGQVFVSDVFDCHVWAFDPSPITKEWYARDELRNHSHYHLMPYGAGGRDQELTLREYNWGQISILQYPKEVLDPTRCNGQGLCQYQSFDEQETFTVPVKTLKTIMSDLGHNRIDVLKIDVEGSEYQFLERMIDDGSCRAVDQITLEWHHYDYDRRYGITSAPHINVLVALLKERCGLEQFWVYSQGWPSNLKLYHDMGMHVYYNEAAFIRTSPAVYGS